MFLSIIISLLLVSILNPLVIFFERRGASRKRPAVIIFGVIMLFSLGIVIFSVLPFLLKMPSLISHDLPLYSENLERRIEKTITYLTGELPFLSSLGVEKKIKGMIEDLPGRLTESTKTFLPDVGIVLFLTPVFTFFLLKDGGKLKRWFISLMPNRYFEMALHLLHRINMQWSRYVRGLALEAFSLGIIMTVLFLPSGLSYKLLLGLFLGIANIVPYIGPIIGTAPVMVVALMLDLPPKMIIYLLVVIFGIGRAIDSMVLKPYLIHKHAHLHTVAIILSLIIGQRIMGIIGVILAIPVASMLNIMIQEIYAFYKFKGRTQNL